MGRRRVELGGGGLGVGERQLELAGLVEADGDGQVHRALFIVARRSQPPVAWLRSRSAAPAAWSPAGGRRQDLDQARSGRGVGGIGLEVVFQDGDGGGVIAALELNLGQGVKRVFKSWIGLDDRFEPGDGLPLLLVFFGG